MVPNIADGNVKAGITLPDTLSVAVAYQLHPQLQLLADYTWTGWDAIQDLAIVRTSGPLSGQTLTSLALHFKNSWRVGFGANYQLTPQWKLRGASHSTNRPCRTHSGRRACLTKIAPGLPPA